LAYQTTVAAHVTALGRRLIERGEAKGDD